MEDEEYNYEEKNIKKIEELNVIIKKIENKIESLEKNK
jgi:hypothetical protein